MLAATLAKNVVVSKVEHWFCSIAGLQPTQTTKNVWSHPLENTGPINAIEAFMKSSMSLVRDETPRCVKLSGELLYSQPSHPGPVV